jgi:putative ABC transport system substrate-binding protein
VPDGFRGIKSDESETLSRNANRVAIQHLDLARNITIEYRWAQGKPEQIREMAEELVRLKVDAIVAPSSIYTGAAKRATSTIPIIFMSHAVPRPSGGSV